MPSINYCKAKLAYVGFLSGLLWLIPIESIAASALAAWRVTNNGVLQLRTSKAANLEAFFKYATDGIGDRVWIDFQGELTRPRVIKGNGSIKEIRLGKPSNGKTRLVVEFIPSVELEPSKLKLIGTAIDKWELSFVGLPQNKLRIIGEGDVTRKTLFNRYKRYPYRNLDYSSLPSVPRGKYTVVIDPGHGGPDPGAVGVQGLRETDIVLDISLKVSRLLSEKGVKTILTRRYDRDLGLQARVTKANNSRADAFVSIHANAIPRGYKKDVNGMETYYYSGYRGYTLAKKIHKEILRVSLKSPDRGVRRSRFFVIRKTSMPAALIEVGFVTGRTDSQMLRQSIYRDKLAFAISKGILNYLRGGI